MWASPPAFLPEELTWDVLKITLVLSFLFWGNQTLPVWQAPFFIVMEIELHICELSHCLIQHSPLHSEVDRNVV